MATPPMTSFFHYEPNKSFAVISMITFAIISCIFAIRIYMTKSANFLYIIPVVAFGESLAFVYRILCINSISLPRFIIMNLFALFFPLVLPLVNYMAIGQVIKHSNVSTNRFFLTSSFVSWAFFASDVLHFWIQRLCELNFYEAPQSLGNLIFLFSVSIQSMTFAAFLFTAIYIHQNPNYNCQIQGIPDAKPRLMICVYITSAMLYIRYIYRITEYSVGYEGAFAKIEWMFYAFDTFMLLSSMFTFGLLFIGNYLPRKNERFSKEDGEYIRVSDVDGDELDNAIAEGKRHVAVFNNVQKVNYTISVDP